MTETDKTIVFRTAGVDIGIYNLGYCVLEFHHSAKDTKVIPIIWGNWDIAARRPRLDVVTEAREGEPRCCAAVAKSKMPGIDGGKICDKKAAFSHDLTKFYCKTHVHQIVKQTAESDMPVLMWEGPVTIPALKTACRNFGVVPLPLKKEDLIRSLAVKYIFPSTLAKSLEAGHKRITEKIPKRTKPTLDELEAGCEFFLDKHPELLTCKGIRIENQGAAHGGTTKSVQIMLYTLLKYAYRSEGKDVMISCINAEDKTQDYSGNIVAVKGSKGYLGRKEQAKEMIHECLVDADEKWMKVFEANIDKADDMADAFLMARRLGTTIIRKDAPAVVVPAKKGKNILPKKANKNLHNDSETE